LLSISDFSSSRQYFIQHSQDENFASDHKGQIFYIMLCAESSNYKYEIVWRPAMRICKEIFACALGLLALKGLRGELFKPVENRSGISSGHYGTVKTNSAFNCIS